MNSSLLKIFIFATLAAACFGWQIIASAGEAIHPATFCNPLNLDYRFQLSAPSRREAADPTLLRYNGE